jgi:hypothetical protein
VSEVTRLLGMLTSGELTIEQVAVRFRHRQWPARQSPPAKSYAQAAAAENSDPEPLVPGSFGEVSAAYARGELTDAEYATLAEAASGKPRK